MLHPLPTGKDMAHQMVTLALGRSSCQLLLMHDVEVQARVAARATALCAIAIGRLMEAGFY